MPSIPAPSKTPPSLFNHPLRRGWLEELSRWAPWTAQDGYIVQTELQEEGGVTFLSVCCFSSNPGVGSRKIVAAWGHLWLGFIRTNGKILKKERAVWLYVCFHGIKSEFKVKFGPVNKTECVSSAGLEWIKKGHVMRSSEGWECCRWHRGGICYPLWHHKKWFPADAISKTGARERSKGWTFLISVKLADRLEAHGTSNTSACPSTPVFTHLKALTNSLSLVLSNFKFAIAREQCFAQSLQMSLKKILSTKGKHWLPNSQIDYNAVSLVPLRSAIFLPFDLFLLHLGKKKINSLQIEKVREAQTEREGEREGAAVGQGVMCSIKIPI